MQREDRKKTVRLYSMDSESVLSRCAMSPQKFQPQKLKFLDFSPKFQPHKSAQDIYYFSQFFRTLKIATTLQNLTQNLNIFMSFGFYELERRYGGYFIFYKLHWQIWRSFGQLAKKNFWFICAWEGEMKRTLRRNPKEMACKDEEYERMGWNAWQFSN